MTKKERILKKEIMCTYKRTHPMSAEKDFCYSLPRRNDHSNTELVPKQDEHTTEYRWIHDLIEMSSSKNYSSDFSHYSLVILRCLTKKLHTKSWSEINEMKDTIIQQYLDKVIVIPRNSSGQIYIAQGLHRSPHFTLHRYSLTLFTDFLSKMEIPFHIIKNTFEARKEVKLDNLYVQSSGYIYCYTLRKNLQEMFERTMEGLWNILFQVSDTVCIRICIYNINMQLNLN